MITPSDIKAIEKQMEFLLEDKRLASFKSKWVFSEDKVCNANKMAEAGFVYIGTRQEPDAVKCFMCGKSLDGWEEDDDPWAEHLKHSNNCTFAKLQKQEDVMTVEELLKVRAELFEILLKGLFQKKKDAVNEVFDELRANLDKL